MDISEKLYSQGEEHMLTATTSPIPIFLRYFGGFLDVGLCRSQNKYICLVIGKNFERNVSQQLKRVFTFQDLILDHSCKIW